MCAEFILCRYVLFDIHGMKQWPCLLFIFGVFVISISFFFKAKRVSVFAALSYSIGFLSGMIFQTDGVDAGGGRTNNFWLIWIVVYICGIIFAIASEWIAVVKKRTDWQFLYVRKPNRTADLLKKVKRGSDKKILLILGSLCIGYCIGIGCFTEIGSWFFLIWGILGELFLLFSYLAGSKKEQNMPAFIKKSGRVMAVLIIFCFIAVEGLIVSSFWKKVSDDLDYLVVLGTRILEDGPSKDLKFRLDTACDYMLKNKNTVAIVSGGQGSNEPVSEALGMHDYLVEHGIDSNRIRMEDKSVSTVENLQFSYRLMEKQEGYVGIVTSNFHVFRGVKLAKAQGYKNVYGLAAPSDRFMLPNNMLREFVVMIKDFLVGNL